MTMDWIALSALAVALVGIPVAVLATRRWGNRRAVVSYAVEVTPLLPEADQTQGLAVSYRDIAVPDPILVTITFVNIGPRDIPSGSFDAGNPIVVRLMGTFYGVTASFGEPDLAVPAVGTAGVGAFIRFGPRLLKRRQSWAVSLIVGGDMRTSLESPLVDTDLRIADPASVARQRAMLLSALDLLPGGVVARLAIKSLRKYKG